ncbi:MAG: caspase family protein [Gammaproteobacteria bacterium]
MIRTLNRAQRAAQWSVAVGCLLTASVLFAQSGAPGLHAPLQPSNHALIITVSEYRRSPLPGVLIDRKLGLELAQRFGVPPQNIVQLSEEEVTREGLKQALATMNQVIMPGDKLYIYFSGHGARFFNKATGQCTESIVMQDMHVVTNSEFAGMLKPLSAKTDKTIVMLDSCHSGGVAHAASSRELGSGSELRAKFSPEASSPQCSLAVNDRSFSHTRGADLNTTDNNLVILAAARNNEVAWDTSKGGALTYNFEQCLNGGAADSDRSGALSMQELTTCVQARLDKSQEDAARQHVTLAGNGALIPALVDAGPASASAATTAAVVPTAPVAQAANPLATLNDIYSQRDDRWQVQANLAQPTLKIGTNLALSILSQRDGFVYLFYQGTQPGSFYLLFPNQLDSNNAIATNLELKLPRQDWSVTALGPRGTDHLLVMVSATPRDFSSLALPAEYVSAAGPFEKIRPTVQAVAHISQIATLSAAAGKTSCLVTGDARDLGVARQCSNVFGAALVSVEESD